MFFYRPLFCVILLFLAVGCASITDRHQYVRVVPDTSSTEIFYNNQKVGQGASTLYITRSKRPHFKFKSNGQLRPINLETSYRWGQSFGGNILLYPYTPGGWLIDYITGAAWDAEDRVDTKKEYDVNKDSRLLILPTTNTNSVDSRLMGQSIQKWLEQNRPDLYVLSFDKTYYGVVGMGFDHESAKVPKDADAFNELIHAEKVTHLVFSDYDSYKKEVHLHIYSPYNEKVVQRYTLPNVESEVNKSTWNWIYSEAFEIVPNTLSIGTLNTLYSGCASRANGDLSYCAQSGKESALSYLSSISLTSVLHFRKRSPWGFYFRFYPDFNISYNQVEFAKADPSLPDLDLDWIFMSMGYGPRLSFILPIGELFLEISPFIAMNYLRLHSKPVYDNTHWVGKTGVTAQTGLNTWLSNHWNMRWFVKVQAQGLLENRNISAIDTGSNFLGGLAIVQSGLSVGYYFHEEKTKFFDWLGLF